jgi:hypothetical protein
MPALIDRLASPVNGWLVLCRRAVLEQADDMPRDTG